MWTLAIYLPLLISDLIPEDCEEWELFLLLLRIYIIAASWEVKPPYLSVLIEEHHSKFIQLYSEKNFIPKMH